MQSKFENIFWLDAYFLARDLCDIDRDNYPNYNSAREVIATFFDVNDNESNSQAVFTSYETIATMGSLRYASSLAAEIINIIQKTNENVVAFNETFMIIF